jgi:hypothetical protein
LAKGFAILFYTVILSSFAGVIGAAINKTAYIVSALAGGMLGFSYGVRLAYVMKKEAEMIEAACSLQLQNLAMGAVLATKLDISNTKWYHKYIYGAANINSMQHFYNRALDTLYCVVLDDETFSREVENIIDPSVRTLAEYMAVNDCTHPNSLVVTATGKKGVVRGAGEYVYEAGEQYEVLLHDDQNCGRWIVIDGSQLSLQREAILRNAFEFSTQIRPSAQQPYPIDAFCSHAWHDDSNFPGAKMAVLRDFAQAFTDEFRRPPRIWFEKFCIKQDENVMESIRLLPCYISCSAIMICMFSKNWVERLWCQSEAADLAAITDANNPVDNMLICPLEKSSYEGARVNIVPKPQNSKAGGPPEVKEALLAAINRFPGGQRTFRQWVKTSLRTRTFQ